MNEWKFIATVEACGSGFSEYISKDGKWCKQVWFDGYEEIFEIS